MLRGARLNKTVRITAKIILFLGVFSFVFGSFAGNIKSLKPKTAKAASSTQAATRLYTSGFELNSTTAGMEYTNNVTNAPTIQTGTVRSGTYAMQTNATAQIKGAEFDYLSANNTGTTATYRAYINIASYPGVDAAVMSFFDSANTMQVSIRMSSAGVLKLWNEEDNAQIGSNSSALSTGTWYRLELLFKHGTNGVGNSFARARIDGVEFASSTTENLVNGAMTVQWGVLTSTTANFYWDDIAVNQDVTGATTNNWPGAGKVIHLKPNGNGTNVAWTNDYLNVDEVTPNDATDVISCSAASQNEDYTMEDFTASGGNSTDTIRVIQGGVRVAVASATSATYSYTMVDGSNTEASANVAVAVTAWNTNDDTAPKTSKFTIYDDVATTQGGIITPTDVNGYTVRIGTSDCTPVVSISTVWMIVEYVPNEGGRLWSSGFEQQSMTAGVEWDATAGTMAISTTLRRSGAASLRTNGMASATAEYLEKTIASANDNGKFFLRTYLYIATAPSAENRIIGFYDSGGTVREYITLDSSRLLRLYDEDGAVGSASSALSTNTWYRIEMQFDSTAASGSHVMEAKIDGTNFATASNRALTNGVTRFRIGANLNTEAQTQGDWYFEDVAINKNVGVTQTTYPGAGSIVHLKPNADGDNVAWTNTYTNIDEATPNDATDLISTSTINAIEEANLEDTATAGLYSSSITLVSVGVRMNISAAATMSLGVRLKESTATNTGIGTMETIGVQGTSTTWFTNNSATPRSYPITAYTRPFREDAWTTTQLDTMQIGVRETVDTTSNLQVSTMWALVEYVPTAFTVSGACKLYDKTTNCADGQTVMVSVSGQAQYSGTTSGGSYSVTIDRPLIYDTVHVWLDNVADANEANAMAQFVGTGNSMTNVRLYQHTLFIGSDDAVIPGWGELDNWDNSASGDEDIFFDVDGSGVLSVDSGNTMSDERLYVFSYFQTNATINTFNFENYGQTTIEINTTMNVGGSYYNDAAATMTLQSGTTVNMTGTTTGNTLNSGGDTFVNLTFNGVGGEWTLSGNNINVTSVLTISNGNLKTSTWDITLTGSGTPFVITSGTFTPETGNLFTYAYDGSFNVKATTYYDLTLTTNNFGVSDYTQTISSGTLTVNNNLTLNGIAFSVGNIILSGSSNNPTISVAGTITIPSDNEFITGTGTVTLSGTGTPLTITGTGLFTASSTSTVNYTGNGATITCSGASYHHLGLRPGGATQQTICSGAQTLTVAGNLTVGNGTNNGANADTNGAAVTVTGNITINTGATFTIDNSASFTVGGNFTNSGTFTAPTGSTTVFNTTATSVITGSTTFYNFTATTSTKIIQVDTGTTITTTSGGVLTLTNITLTRETGDSGSWTINHQGTESVTSVTVSWSACHVSSTGITVTTSTDGGNNGACWLFPVTRTFSGIVYANDESTAYGTVTAMKLSVNGGTAQTTNSTVTTGAFSFSVSGPNAGDIITIWLDTTLSGVQGTLVLKYGTSCTSTPDCTGLKVVRDQVRIQNFHTGNMVNTDLAACDNDTGTGCTDTDLGFTANSGVLTTTWTTNEIKIPTSTTFAPGGNISTKKLDVDGTYTGATETLTITGAGTSATCTNSAAVPLCVGGTFTPTSNTVAFTSTTTTSINPGTFNNLSFTPAGTVTHTLLAGTYNIGGVLTIGDATNAVTVNANPASITLDVNGNFILNTNAIFQAPGSGKTFNLGAGFPTNNGTFTNNSGTLTFDSTGSGNNITGTSCGSSFYRMVFSGSGGAWNMSYGGIATCLGDGGLSITNGTVTLAGNLYVAATEGTGILDGSGTLTYSSTPTITFNNGNFANAGNWTVYGIVVGDGGAATHTNSGAGSLTIDSSLVITSSHIWNAGAKTYIFTGNGTSFANSGTFNADTSTFRFTGSGATNIPCASITYYNLEVKPASSTAHTLCTAISQTLAATGSVTLGTGSTNTITAATYNPTINIGGSLSIANNATYTKGTGTTTFNGSTVSGVTFTDSNATKQNIGIVIIAKTHGTPSNNKLTLASSMTVDTMTISANNTLDLAGSSYTFTIANTGATASVLTNNGTFTAGTSTTIFIATNSGGNIIVPALTYSTLQLNGVETYEPATGTLNVNANFTIGNGSATIANFDTSDPTITVTGNFTVSTSATLTISGQSTLYIAGNMTNSGSSTFGGTIDFNKASSTQTINAGGADIYNLTHSGAGTLQVVTNALNVTNNFTNSAGTFDNNSLNLTVHGDYSNSGVFSAGTTTTTFNPSTAGKTLSGTMTGTSKFYNIVFNNASGNYTFNAAAEVANDFTISTGTVTAPSSTLTIGRNFSNSGTFAHNTGTVVLNTTTTSVITGSTTFYSFTSTTSTKIIQVDTATTITTTSGGVLTLTGVTITRETGDSGSWTINHQGTESISGTTISWSACHGSSTNIDALTSNSNVDGGNNGVCWIFSSGVTISGNAYDDEATGDLAICNGSTQNLSVKVGSQAVFNTTCADSGNAFTFSGITQPAAGDIITIFINTNGGSVGTLVDRYDGTGDVTGLILRKNRLIIMSDDATAITNNDLNNYDSTSGTNGQDSDVVFDVTAGSLIVEDGIKLIVLSGKNFTPGGTITTSPSNDGTDSNVDGDLDVQSGSTLAMGANALSIGGDLNNAGTITSSGSQTTTFTATAVAHTIEDNTSNFINLTFNGSGGGWSMVSTVTLSGDLTMTAGTLSGTQNLTVNGGDVTGNGTINLTGGTFALDGVSGNFGGDTSWTFNNLSFTDVTPYTTATGTGTGDINISGTLLIAADRNLNCGGKNWVLNATTGSPVSLYGNIIASTSTFTYAGNNSGGNTTITNLASGYYNLVLNASETFVYSGTLLINNDLTLTQGTLSGSTGVTVNGGDVTGTGTITLTNGTFLVDGTGNFGSTTNWTFYNLTFGDGSGTTTTTATSTSTITVTNLFTIAANQTLNAGSKTYDLTGTGITPWTRAGVFNYNTSHVKYSGGHNTTITPDTYYDLTIAPNGNGSAYVMNNGTLTVNHNLILGNGVNTGTSLSLIGGNIPINITGDFTINTGMSFTAATTGNITVGGSWTNNGNFNHNSKTVTFNGTGGSNTIVAGGNTQPFDTIIINGSGTWTVSTNALKVNNTLTVDNGTLQGAQDVTVSGGYAGGTGTINMSGGTFLIDGDGGFSTDGHAFTFYNLTFGDGVGAQEITTGGGFPITVTNVLTIAANQTLTNESISITLSGSGTPFVKTGTYATDNSLSVTYTSGSGVTALTSGSVTFPHLVINGAGTFNTNTNLQVKNTLTVSGGTLALGTYDLVVGDSVIPDSGSIQVASGQSLTQSSGGTTTIFGEEGGNNCIGSTAVSCAGTSGTITFGNLTLGNNANQFNTTLGGTTPTITVAGLLNITGDASLNGGSGSTINLTGNGTVLTNSGTFTAGTSTIAFNSTNTTGTTIPALTYYNLTVNRTSNTFTSAGGTYTVGNNLTITSGILELNTNDPVLTITGNLAISGTLSASNTNNLTIGGNFVNNGTFTHNNGTVVMNPVGITVQVNGTTSTTNFYNFTMSPSTEKTIQFKNGGTIGFAGTVTIGGYQGIPINIASDSAGVRWNINLTGTSVINYVYIKDSGCSGGTNTVILGQNAIDGSNNGACWRLIVRNGGGATGGGGDAGVSGGGAGQSGGGQGGGSFVTATGTAVLTNNAVTSVTINSGGSNYVSSPNVCFVIVNGGSGAIGTVTISNGSVTIVNITNGGSGYVSAPTVVFQGGDSPDPAPACSSGQGGGGQGGGGGGGSP